MKKLIILLTLIMTFTLNVNGENNQNQKPKQIVVNVDDLTPDQLAKVNTRNKVEEVTGQLETYSKYAGMGKEVGTAVSEGLTAVKDVTLEFADSNVGKLTMGLIVWKVIGDDVKGFVFGIPLWLLIITILLWSYKKTCIRSKILIKKEGGWWIFGGIKEYETVLPTLDSGGGSVVHLLVAMIVTAFMFGGLIF